LLQKNEIKKKFFLSLYRLRVLFSCYSNNSIIHSPTMFCFGWVSDPSLWIVILAVLLDCWVKN
jgi:hypothetical protein